MLPLDLVGDVGDDLHRAPQIVPPALPVEHVPVDLAGGDGGVDGEIFVDEPLVVAQVQVGLRPVVGDEHLPVLIGAHGAGVHVEIGVQLLHLDPQAPLLQQTAQAGRRNALAQAGHHTAGDENILDCHIDSSVLELEYWERGDCSVGIGAAFGRQPSQSRLCRARIPIPFVPSGHFPLTRGIGPHGGAKVALSVVCLLPPPLGEVPSAHTGRRGHSLPPKKGEGHPWENLLPTGAPLRLSVIEFVGLILGLAGELQSQLAVGDLVRRRQDDGAVGLAAL